MNRVDILLIAIAISLVVLGIVALFEEWLPF
jgi:nitrogen fixation-related uncharacterized protein